MSGRAWCASGCPGRLAANECICSHPDSCHCGERVVFGYDGDPTHHRGMCEHCDPIRCDAYPGECGRPSEDFTRFLALEQVRRTLTDTEALGGDS